MYRTTFRPFLVSAFLMYLFIYLFIYCFSFVLSLLLYLFSSFFVFIFFPFFFQCLQDRSAHQSGISSLNDLSCHSTERNGAVSFWFKINY
jgi:hypothetical protein